MSIADQIQNYNDGLLDAYDSVQTKGGTIPENKNLVNLPDAIDTIHSGGGRSATDIRPAEWPQYTGEMIASPFEGVYYTVDNEWKDTTVQLKATLNSGKYVVERGTVSNGVFTAQTRTELNSAATFSEDVSTLADDYLCYRLTPLGEAHITLISEPNVAYNQFLEVYGRLPYGGIGIGEMWKLCRLVTLHDAKTLPYFMRMSSLRYIDIDGLNSSETSLYYRYNACASLDKVTTKGMHGTITDVRNFLSGLTSVREIDLNGLDISGTTVTSLLGGAQTVRKMDIRGMNFAANSSLTADFLNCNLLEEIDLTGIDLSLIKKISYFGGNDYYLRRVIFQDVTEYDYYDETKTYRKNSIVRVDDRLYRSIQEIETPEAWDASHWNIIPNSLSNVTSINYIAKATYVDPIAGTIPISWQLQCNLTEENLVAIMNKMPEVTGQTWNIGATNLNKLSDEEKAIATGKGWTLA